MNTPFWKPVRALHPPMRDCIIEDCAGSDRVLTPRRAFAPYHIRYLARGKYDAAPTSQVRPRLQLRN